MPYRSEDVRLNEKRISGHIDLERRRYVTHRKRKRHFFRLFNGYGISVQVLEALKKQRINDILLIEKSEDGEERVYMTTVEEFLENGSVWVDETHTRKPDKQLVLSMSFWK